MADEDQKTVTLADVRAAEAEADALAKELQARKTDEGHRRGGPMQVEQKPESWLAAASPEQIDTAYRAGELDEVMGVARNEAGNRLTDLRGVQH